MQIGNFNSGNNSFIGTIDEVGLLNDVALAFTDVQNLYNALSSHKLDKPLVTKTDSDGNSITGYEFFSTHSNTNKDAINYVEVLNMVNQPKNQEPWAMYVEVIRRS